MCTDLPDSMGRSFLGLCGYSMSKRAAEHSLRQSGLSLAQVDVIEVHDCFSPNEVGVVLSLRSVNDCVCSCFSQ